ncbi:MAG: dienelactone hydrolase family protein [Gordonia sp. (in: high G+C Gram-positive bacteria)]
MSATANEDIEIRTLDGTAQAYVSTPADPTTPATAGGRSPHPGVLFFVDAIGLRAQTKKMADRIASWGYTVLVPHVFYRDGSAAELAPAHDLLNSDTRAEFIATAMPRVRALTPELAERDLIAYLGALEQLTPGPVAAIGYCMGGRLALHAGALRPDIVTALAMFHTGGLVLDSPDSPHRMLAAVQATVLAIHADNDRSMPAQAIARFEHALIEAGVIHSATVYPGAEHGYTMADTGVYHHEAAEYHYTQLHKLLANALG